MASDKNPLDSGKSELDSDSAAIIFTNYSPRSHVIAGVNGPFSEELRKVLKEAKLANYHPRLYPKGNEGPIKGWLFKKEKIEEITELAKKANVEVSSVAVVPRVREKVGRFPFWGFLEKPNFEAISSKPGRESFNGLTVQDLTPLSFIETRRKRNGSENSKVRIDKEKMPLKVGDLVFEAGTLLTLGGPKIRMAGIVVKALKTKNVILVLEGGVPGNIYNLLGIYSWSLADPEKYGVPKKDMEDFLRWGKKKVR